LGEQRAFSVVARIDNIHGVPGGSERARQAIGQHTVIFCNENSHGSALLSLGLTDFVSRPMAVQNPFSEV
jgi:hypothetical protein